LATAIRVLDAISSLDPKKRKQQHKLKQQSSNSQAEEEKKGEGSDIKDHNNNDEEEEDGLDRYRRSDLRQFRKSLSFDDLVKELNSIKT
jgi:hypothetical protein